MGNNYSCIKHNYKDVNQKEINTIKSTEWATEEKVKENIKVDAVAV